MAKEHYELFKGERTQLVRGTVRSIDRGRKVFTVHLDPTVITGELLVEVPFGRTSSMAPEARKLGKAITTRLGGIKTLEGDLQRIPKPREKLLMRLLFVGSDGFRCLAWTYLALANAVDVVNELSSCNIEGNQLDNP